MIGTSFEPLASHVIQHPYWHYALFRELAPVHWHERLKAWVCTDYETCRYVLRHPEFFTTDPRRLGTKVPDVMNSLQSLDPPEHTPLRHLLASAFRAQDMDEMEKQTRAGLEERLAALAHKSLVDLVTELIAPVALDAICRFLGVAPPDLQWFLEVSDRLVLGMDAGFNPEAIPGAMRARGQLSSLAARWMSEAPQEGVVGFLLARQESKDISPELLANTIRATFHAGHSSSSRFMENATLVCLCDANAKAAVRGAAGTDAMRPVIEELIRYDGPVQAESRICAADTTLGGHEVLRGDTVTLILGAANHDPAVFENSEQVVFDRSPNPHLGFGRGTHSCLGAGLALLETRILLEVLFQEFPHAALAAVPVRRPTGTLRGVAHMPVRLRP